MLISMLDRASSMLLPLRLKFVMIFNAQNLFIVDYPQKYRVLTDRCLAPIIVRVLQNIDDTKNTLV